MRIFILEGLPGSGKTFILNKISKELNMFKVDEILNDENKPFPSEEVMTNDQNFYFQSDERKFILARKLSKSKNVIMDRFFPSTIAYNLCIKEKNNDSFLYDKLEKLKLKFSSKVIFIYIKIKPSTSISRKKKNNSEDLWSYEKNLIKTAKFYNEYFNNNPNAIIIDGEFQLSVVYKKVAEKIENYDKSLFRPSV